MQRNRMPMPVHEQPAWYLTPERYAEYQTAYQREQNRCHIEFVGSVARLFLFALLAGAGLVLAGIGIDRILLGFEFISKLFH